MSSLKLVSDTPPPLAHLFNVPLRNQVRKCEVTGWDLPVWRNYNIFEAGAWPEMMTQHQAVGFASYKYRKAWKGFLGADKWESFRFKRTGYLPE